MAFEIEDHIRVRAYHLWEASGRPEGRDLEFWEQARQTASQEEPAPTRRGSRDTAGVSAAARAAKRRRTTRKHADQGTSL
jgi:hypothetical protein